MIYEMIGPISWAEAGTAQAFLRKQGIKAYVSPAKFDISGVTGRYGATYADEWVVFVISSDAEKAKQLLETRIKNRSQTHQLLVGHPWLRVLIMIVIAMIIASAFFILSLYLNNQL